MIDRPLPLFPDKVALGWEEDAALDETRKAFCELPPDLLAMFIATRGFPHLDVLPEPFAGPHQCYLLRVKETGKSPRIKETRKVLKMLSKHIGMDPAFFYYFIPHEYSERRSQYFRYSFLVKCQHHRRHCIRPSHLVTCDYTGNPLRDLVPTLSLKEQEEYITKEEKALEEIEARDTRWKARPR